VDPNDPHSHDPRDAAIDHAYRETAREAPPRALDARILAAAHRAVAARPAPVRADWTRRWRVPLSVAATVLLSATITLMVYESENAPPPLAPARPEVDGAGGAQREDQRSRVQAPERPAEAERKTAPETEAQAAPKRQASSASEPAAPGVVAPSATPPAPFPADARAKPSAPMQAERGETAPLAKESAPAQPPSAPARARAAPLPPPAQPSTAPGKREAEPAATGPAGAGAATATENRALADRPAGRAAEAAPAPARTPAPAARALPAMKPAPATRPAWLPPSGRVAELVTPEDWVAEIRWLKREGRDAEAATWLAELEARFPGYTLPDDLR